MDNVLKTLIGDVMKVSVEDIVVIFLWLVFPIIIVYVLCRIPQHRLVPSSHKQKAVEESSNDEKITHNILREFLSRS